MLGPKVRLSLLGWVIVSACVGDGDAADTSGAPRSERPDEAAAEAFVDAFYSFDRARLAPLIASADSTGPRTLAYQNWAEGGHYEVIERRPCRATEGGVVRCSITVRDDLVAALRLGWWVTDHFDLRFADGRIRSVVTSSNDPQVYLDARAWVEQHRPELIAEACKRDPATNVRLTPGLCAAAMRQGYLAFAASDDFPDELPPEPGS
jgi:hypothetical protein